MTAKPLPEPRRNYRHFSSITTRWMDNDAYVYVDRASRRPAALPPVLLDALQGLM